MMSTNSGSKNLTLLVPFLAPYGAFVLIGGIEGFVPRQWNYVLKIVVSSIAMCWAWKYYIPLKGPKSVLGSIIIGVFVGFIGLWVWVLIKSPFVTKLGNQWNNGAFYARLLASSLLVPIFEEQFVRGYILRVAYQWDMARKRGESDPFGVAMEKESVYDVPPGAWTFTAVGISTVGFTMGHSPSEWLACIPFSLIMVFLWVVRKDLLSCIVAHAVTNITLAFYIKFTGKWGLW